MLAVAGGCGGGENGRGEPDVHGEHGGSGVQAHAEHGGHADHAGHTGGEGHDEHAEGTVRLSAAQRAAAQIEVAPAGPHVIVLTQELPGEVVVNADELAHVVPRFPGIAREVRKKLGDRVQSGEVLAIIESNESLSPYEVKSLIAGTVIGKHITLGEFVRDDSDIFVIADLSTVWVNITVYPGQLDRVRPGQEAHVLAVGGEQEALARIDYVGPVLGEATRSATARAVLPNPARQWRPGMFVTARIVTARETVPLAVPDQAMVQLEGRPCIFVEAANEFHPRPIEPGRTDGQWTEVRSGIETGERFVSEGAFILKSELLKSAAGHEH